MAALVGTGRRCRNLIDRTHRVHADTGRDNKSAQNPSLRFWEAINSDKFVSSSVVDQWWPVTYDYGLIRSDLDDVAQARQKMHCDAGLELTETVLNAPLEDCLSLLAPLSPAPNKELYLQTSFGWTAYLANGCRGSCASLPMKQLAGALGTTAIRACAAHHSALYPGHILEVFDTPQAGANAYGYRRSIAAANDGGRWVFEQSGIPFDFEDTSRYAERLKRDRFTREMLATYLVELGAQPLSDRTLYNDGATRAILLERTAPKGLPQYTLDQAKAL